ncbi:MAG: YdcF family protein [Patescibacteria group bacterium]
MENTIDAQHPDEIHKTLARLVTSPPDAFFVLAGAMTYDETKGEYVTGSFDTLDENSTSALGVALPSGGRDRVLAAFEMHKAFPEAYLVTMSKTRDGNKPTYASVARKELVEKGVDQNRILLSEASVDTITELKEAIRLSRERGWRHIVLIVGEWQRPRAEALLNHIEDFVEKEEEKFFSSFVSAITTGALAVHFLDTTTILSAVDDTHKRFFEETLGAHPGMQARIIAEANGVRQIAEGTYGGRKLTHKMWKEKP